MKKLITLSAAVLLMLFLDQKTDLNWLHISALGIFFCGIFWPRKEEDQATKDMNEKMEQGYSC